MTSALTIINRASRSLLSGLVEERNKLATALSDTTGTAVVTTYDLKGLAAGVVLEIDSELMYIWVADAGSKTLTVERGYGGSTAATHSAAAVITLNPKFPKQQLLDTLNSEIDDLSSPTNGLFRIVVASLTYNGSSRQINLTSATSVLGLVDVSYKYLATDYVPMRNTELKRDMATADFESGFALTINDSIPSGTVRVTYRAPFVRVVTTADDLQTVSFVPAVMEDILELGLQIRMIAPREPKRSYIESQGDTRRSEEVPPGSAINSVAGLMRLKRDRIAAESARLNTSYPLTIRR